jgi:transposase
MASQVDGKKVGLTKPSDEIASLRNTVASLNREIRNLFRLLSGKDKENAALKHENDKLRSENQQLKDNIALLKGGRDSRTSSTSPSQDMGRSNSCNLRTPGGKKTGGQPGHTGHHLQMTGTPDEIIDHIPSICTCCGKNMEDVPCDSYIPRQVVDIPPVRPVYTEHRSHIKICPSCGADNKGDFPATVVAPIQYGPVIEATTGYLSAYQYIPYRRITRFFRDFFSLPLSEGSVDRFLENLDRKATSTYESIRELIQSAPVVGADETGCKVNGKKHWFHVWQNRWLTFIVAFKHRSHEVVEQYFPGGFPNSSYISDCYASQLKTPAKVHQVCLAHLSRELKNFVKHLDSKWSAQMRELLHQAWELKDNMTTDDYLYPPMQVAEINNRLDELLAQDRSMFHQKEQALAKRLIKHRNSILTFLEYKNVPPHNNGSELSIRNVKVKTKVFGQFRNNEGKGADRYAKIRSVIDTAIKNGIDVHAALLSISKYQKLIAE